MTMVQNQPIVAHACRKHQQFNQDERLRALDEAHQRYLHDLATDIEAKASEIARNLKRAGLAADFIAQMTGLTCTEVERLD